MVHPYTQFVHVDTEFMHPHTEFMHVDTVHVCRASLTSRGSSRRIAKFVCEIMNSGLDASMETQFRDMETQFRDMETAHRHLEDLDVEFLKRFELLTKMPTSMSHFTGHVVYALRSKLRVDEHVPVEKKPVGLFKGENVYLRADVSKVKSIAQWIKEGRQVEEGEIDKPVKEIVKKKKIKQPQFTFLNHLDPEDVHDNQVEWGSSGSSQHGIIAKEKERRKQGQNDSYTTIDIEVPLYSFEQTKQLTENEFNKYVVAEGKYVVVKNMQIPRHKTHLSETDHRAIVRAAKLSKKSFQIAIVDFKYANGKFESIKDGILIDTIDEQTILQIQQCNLHQYLHHKSAFLHTCVLVEVLFKMYILVSRMFLTCSLFDMS